MIFSTNYYFSFIFSDFSLQYIDLLGTGITAKNRPPDFCQRHVDLSLYRKIIGLNKLPPEKLETIDLPNIDQSLLLSMRNPHTIDIVEKSNFFFIFPYNSNIQI